VLGDDDASVLALQALDDLGETILDVRQRHLIRRQHSHKYSQKLTIARSWLLLARGGTPNAISAGRDRSDRVARCTGRRGLLILGFSP
jgi:hypothetical protein